MSHLTMGPKRSNSWPKSLARTSSLNPVTQRVRLTILTLFKDWKIRNKFGWTKKVGQLSAGNKKKKNCKPRSLGKTDGKEKSFIGKKVFL